jgi:NTE family protein
MASACLPMLFQAIEIDGQHYWDGGFSLNPPLSPLISHCRTDDVMLVQINPLQREETPRTSGEIRDRVNELMFNASLLTQMRAIDFINRLGRAKTVRMHRVDAGPALAAYPSSSRATADGAMIEKLFQAGAEAGRDWLHEHYGAIGHHATVDIRRDYLDDTRLEVPQADRTGFRPWLARLLRRT